MIYSGSTLLSYSYNHIPDTITVKDGTQRINDYSLPDGCIIIPDSVTEIGEQSFSGYFCGSEGSAAQKFAEENDIDFIKKCHQITKEERTLLQNILTSFEINITNPIKEGEIVSSGGINLSEINSKTMESKLTKGLYFCGEVIDVDGFCGGYNLQNCWSTGYVAGINL